MQKTYEAAIPLAGDVYQTRLYEDLEAQAPAIFVVESGDGKPMSDERAREVFGALESNTELQGAEPRFWEQAPDGKITEHQFSSYTHDINSMQDDIPGDYRSAVEAGKVEPQMRMGYNHQKTEVEPAAVQETVGEPVEAYNVRNEAEWRSLNGPSMS